MTSLVSSSDFNVFVALLFGFNMFIDAFRTQKRYFPICSIQWGEDGNVFTHFRFPLRAIFLPSLAFMGTAYAFYLARGAQDITAALMLFFTFVSMPTINMTKSVIIFMVLVIFQCMDVALHHYSPELVQAEYYKIPSKVIMGSLACIVMYQALTSMWRTITVKSAC